MELEDDSSDIDKKYKTSCDINHINFDSNSGNRNLSLDGGESNKNMNNQDESNINEQNEIKEEEYLQKFKEIFGHIEEYRNLRIVQKYFIEWEKLSKVDNNSNDINDINNSNEIYYSKNVNSREACRSLSDVFLDFKTYLIKHSLKIKNKKE